MLHKEHDIQREINPCMACCGRYLRKECLFQKAKCFRCGNRGHVKSHCRIKMTKIRTKQEKINSLLSAKKKRIETTGVEMSLDTGSDTTMINEETWRQIGKPKIFKSTEVAYGVR